MNNNLEDVLSSIDEKIARMLAKLKACQNADGGLKGFYTHDINSGVWSTAEVIHMVAKTVPNSTVDWLEAGRDYLLQCQNPDGGWPFRRGGKSVTDITSWCCLALSHFDCLPSIERGVRFILSARNNTGVNKDDAWGLTSFEDDRVYSTWIASYCLHRLLTQHAGHWAAAALDEDIQQSLREAKSWLLRTMNDDGSWSPTSGSAAHLTSTAVALLTLFMQGHDPRKFEHSYQFLRQGLRNGLWPPENEIVVTQEGYELAQQWFTSALAFRAMIFFVELGIASLDEVDELFTHLESLIHQDGGVSLQADSIPNLIWTVPYMIEALDKYRLFIRSAQKRYAHFLEKQFEKRIRTKRSKMDDILRSHFPFPISAAFSAFQHELDHHRKFQLLLQLYEIAVKYAAIVALSGYLSAKEQDESINRFLGNNFKRPSLGDWTRLFEALTKDSKGFEKLLYPQAGGDLLKSLQSYFEDSTKVNLNQALGGIVQLRNSNTGHGAIRTLYEYKLMIEAEEGKLYSFFDRLEFLAQSNSFLVLASEYDEFGEGDRYKIRIFKGLTISDNDLETSSRLSEGQRETMVRYIYFQNMQNNTIVNLYPFVSYMFCHDCKREHFFFYNALRSREKVSYLSYACGHTIERDNTTHFEKRLNAIGVSWL
jgi:prenyltransferase beta subunit